MERYSIAGESLAVDAAIVAENKSLEAQSKRPLRFPIEDDGKSLASMAERDLQAALQLLAERAQYITGASGAAIAMLDSGEMICRASCGPSAPKIGSQLQVQSGLTAESVRLKTALRCDDAEQDSRVNREGCRALGIRSVMVTPLVRDAEAVGLFELLADRRAAFEDRDVAALENLSQMVLTALEHADAAKRARDEIIIRSEEIVRSELIKKDTNAAQQAGDTISAKPAQPEASQPGESSSAATAKVRTCGVCGFPVSEGRTVCVDCEQSGRRAESSGASDMPATGILSQLARPVRNENWFERHMYTIGTVVMVGLTVLALYLKFH